MSSKTKHTFPFIFLFFRSHAPALIVIHNVLLYGFTVVFFALTKGEARRGLAVPECAA